MYGTAAIHPDAVVIDFRSQCIDHGEPVCTRLPVFPIRLKRCSVGLDQKIRDAGLDQQGTNRIGIERTFRQMYPLLNFG